ncbi:PREDICTED: peroxiredoxin-2E-1, chloroplastic-like [Nelumbo nucifera]|uniref:glutaredoxin-dependent peroxiredoxin n=2 Tax=Nelumbo nucifera TaxID=4432 RepID=A0A822XPM6_NELNU|nr:PREDICTED: peroxiredoxin-2E-1, chloroplastic-like [Nelumbo nucifera]DAD21633.1 TPA_asm: hypothetical protein HUJ06_023096 [Nelumbo nucifera]
MATSVNNIAATFATLPVSSSSFSSSSSSSSSLSPALFAASMSPQPISAAWNPHAALPRSKKSSLLSLYGGPGPRPLHFVTFRPGHHITQRPAAFISVGDKLPNVTLSYLDRNNKLHTVAVPTLAKGKKVVVIGVSAAFSPSCTRFVRAAEEKNADVVTCVAMNDVFVMKAWGEHLEAGGDKPIMMLSDGQGEFSRALGMSLDISPSSPPLGLGTRSRRFCLVALNGVVKSLRLDEEHGFVPADGRDVLYDHKIPQKATRDHLFLHSN